MNLGAKMSVPTDGAKLMMSKSIALLIRPDGGKFLVTIPANLGQSLS